MEYAKLIFVLYKFKWRYKWEVGYKSLSLGKMSVWKSSAYRRSKSVGFNDITDGVSVK